MKKMNKFFERADRFNFPISFRYKKDDSYSTSLGGIVSLLIILLTVGFFIYFFIPFCKRKNYSLYYYTINLDKTEEINLKNSITTIAFAFDSPEEKPPLTDFLDLEVNYIYYKYNDTISKYKKQSKPIGIHQCNNTDFYNKANILKSLGNKINNLICLDELDHVIKNQHQDKEDNFTYFQIDIKAKNNTDSSVVRNFLLDNDCKVELYYLDVKIEVDDYKEPNKTFLNKVFLQLNPDFVVKMDTYFMNEYFESINDLFFPTKGKDKINNLFSRTEQYFLYQGINSKEGRPFAQIFIRADTRKMEIKRKYQTVMEFFADTFYFWEVIFFICQVIFNIYNRISLNYYLESELFFFKGEKNKYFEISSNYEKIKNLIKKFENKKINGSDKMIIIKDIGNEDNGINLSKETNIREEVNPGNEIKKNINIKYNTNICKEIKYFFMKIFNIFKCKCCKCKKSNREILSTKAQNIINNKLDIICYMKYMLLLDVVYGKMKEDKKEILKFLSMPIISSVKDEEEEENQESQEFINHFTEQDFELLFIKINNLLKQSTIANNDKNYIKLVIQQLKKLLNE